MFDKWYHPAVQLLSKKEKRVFGGIILQRWCVCRCLSRGDSPWRVKENYAGVKF